MCVARPAEMPDLSAYAGKVVFNRSHPGGSSIGGGSRLVLVAGFLKKLSRLPCFIVEMCEVRPQEGGLEVPHPGCVARRVYRAFE